MRRISSIATLLLFIVFSHHAFAQKDDRSLYDLVKKNALQLHISDEDAANAIISNSYIDPQTNIRYVYLQQAYRGINVFNGIMTIIFRDNEVLYSSGKFFYGLSAKAQQLDAKLDAAQAVVNAAHDLKLSSPSGLNMINDKMPAEKKIVFSAAGIAKKEIEAQLVWVKSADQNSIRLVWNVNIDVLGSPDWWNVRIDAISGEVIEKNNWTIYENANDGNQAPNKSANTEHYIFKKTNEQEKHFLPPPPTVTAAGYYVIPFPYESPNHHALALENQPWLKAGAGNAATTNGWHFDGTINYDITRGNNAFAYLDVQNNNTPNAISNWPDTSTSAIPSLTFGNIPDFSQQPSVALNKKAALNNLFYWNNIMHDVTYQYGFNEVSGNFQTDNIGRGGNGNDYVQAEAEDASGTNNANFATPADGGRPRMQMYLWTGAVKLNVNAPASIAGSYLAVESGFSTANKLATIGPVTGQLVYFNDAGGTHEACSGAPTNSLTGKIALILRSTCNFTQKVKAAQDAGAIGVVMVDNVTEDPIIMGGTDNTITIPALMITQGAGALLAAQISGNVNVTLVPPVQADGDYDNSIVCHEYTHGISSRLTGGAANASCLSNAEQGGEGWSDYVSLMMTTNWATAHLTDGALSHPMGTYVINESVTGGGIRTYPYTTNMAVNPHNYGEMTGNPEAHFIGEIWCSTLWDMTWNIIQQSGSIETNLYNAGSTGGNAIAMKLVMEGLRLQPCQPGFLDARDAILAADSILYNGAHKCAIWKAFARRGMGFSAYQGLSTSATDQSPAFDVPSAVSLSKSATPVILSNGSQTTINIAATCQCQVPANNYTIRDTIPSGFNYVSNTGGGTLSGNVVNFSAVNFTTEQQVKNFSVTIQASSSGCFVDTAINDDRTTTIGGLTSASATGTSQWTSSNTRSKSPSASWFAPSAAVSTDFTLTSNSFTAGNLSVLSFWQYYVTENIYDGGRVEISTNNGGSWIDAGPYMVQNGYNNKTDASSPWASGAAFTGVSYGQGSNQFINTVLNLSPFSGQQVKVRFRMRTDVGNPANFEGWFIDDIMQLNGCGGMVKAGLYNASNIKIDSSAVPVFIRATGTPTNILSQPAAAFVCASANVSFTVSANGGTLTYQWQVSTDGGGSYANISGATSATLNLAGVVAGMNGNLYRCIVDNGTNQATSVGAMLTINAATNVGTIANAVACENANASFSATATGGSLGYQWQSSTDGTNFTNVTGATANTLSLTTVTTAQNNNKYRVIVTGSCGTVTSTVANLTVNSLPVVTVSNIPNNVCTTDAAYTLSASQTGGVWSGQGMSGGQFSPAGLGAGTHVVTYSVTNASGCVGSASASILVSDCADKHLTLDAPGAILLYPNPNDGKFSIKFNTDLYSSLQMRVYASDGKLVSTQMINGIIYGTVTPVNLRSLAAAVYQLSLYDAKSGKERTFRFTIMR